MPARLHHIDPRGRLHWYTPPHKSASEINAELEVEWARQRAHKQAEEAAERHAIDTRLEVGAVDLYQQLGKAIVAVTSEQGWIGLYDEVERLVAERELSSRHGKELNDRLLRVAKDRRWVSE